MNWKQKSVAIIGSAGLIGTELSAQLFKKGAFVFCFDLADGFDARDYHKCLYACSKADYVFHLAGIKGSPKMTETMPADFMQMLQFDSNMIFAAQACSVNRFLYTSSIAVENPETDEYPAHAKLTAEKLIDAHRIQYPEGTKFVIVRPANVYGRFDNFNNPDSMVITSLINKGLAKSNFIEMWGDGNNVRDFINAKDVARGMIQAMEEMPNYPVNLCSGEGVKIKEVIKLIAKYTKKKIVKIPLAGQTTGANKRVMKRNWNFKPKISLKKGIKEAVKYACNRMSK